LERGVGEFDVHLCRSTLRNNLEGEDWSDLFEDGWMQAALWQQKQNAATIGTLKSELKIQDDANQEIERLNKIIADQDETFQVWIKHREQDKSEIKKLRLALKYAADKENWSEPDPGCPYWILWDDGNPITWDYFEKVLSAGGGK
jgi:hypothetical protein